MHLALAVYHSTCLYGHRNYPISCLVDRANNGKKLDH